MSEAKWTPGPWRYNVATDGRIVAPQERGADVEIVEADAANPVNSRLIAAAPDLAAAIQLMIDSLEGRDIHPEKAIGACRTALAKARSE